MGPIKKDFLLREVFFAQNNFYHLAVFLICNSVFYGRV